MGVAALPRRSGKGGHNSWRRSCAQCAKLDLGAAWVVSDTRETKQPYHHQPRAWHSFTGRPSYGNDRGESVSAGGVAMHIYMQPTNQKYARSLRGDKEIAPFMQFVPASHICCVVMDGTNKFVWSSHKDGRIRSWSSQRWW
ncbi:hypothetical protein VPH35_054213 [Triticum aestivum]|uniref:IP5PC-F beta-propeller domain-containing protein n=2 Tax=Triticum TaxID=4564 RepID=A0A9R1QSB8_TRITD|nr:unnamed protein product [Triticum aestivum]VAH82408.1 unnamed protein product [Triticum turgidum subsp. durum]